jgi:hypothetical protein
MTVMEELAQLLDDRGLGTYRADGAAGGTIFLLALPTAPDRCMALAPYGQGATEADSRLAYDEIRFQVRCRGSATDARQAEADGQAVYDSLHGLGMLTLAGGTWLQLALGIQSGPIYMGRDQNGRHELAVNFRAELGRATANRT